MKIRTFLAIILLLGALLAISAVLYANNAVLIEEIRLWRGITLSVGEMLLAFFVLGFAVAFSVGFSRELGLIIERYRLRKASRTSDEIEDEYSRGLVAVLEGREDEALGHFRAVLERDSRHFNTLIKLGEVLRSQEKYAEAIEFHRKAHHLKEDNTQPLYALVEDHEAKGDLERARVVLGKLIGINKNSVAAWRKLRSLHVKGQHWEKAMEAHQRVEKLASAATANDETDRRCGLGIRSEIAATRLEEGKTREAIAILRRLLKEDERFIPAHVLLGKALLSNGEESAAVQAWYAGFEATGSPIFLTVLEEHYLQREKPLAAIEALKRCIANSTRDTLPRFYLGKLYFRLEMLDDAFSVLSTLEGRASYAPTLHYLLGRIHERRDNHVQASAEYRKVIKEMELVQLEYRCRACQASLMVWASRCSSCDEWNTIEVDFREEISLEELGLARAPIYSTHS